MRYTRDHVIRIDDEDWYDCCLCGGYGPVESDIHDENCPFFDPEVDRIWVTGKKRLADHTICGRCLEDTEKCPAAAHYGQGWAVTEHARLLKICEEYRYVVDSRKKD